MHEAGDVVPAVGCAVGAWLGAIPLCLDWEQPWQVRARSALWCVRCHWRCSVSGGMRVGLDYGTIRRKFRRSGSFWVGLGMCERRLFFQLCVVHALARLWRGGRCCFTRWLR